MTLADEEKASPTPEKQLKALERRASQTAMIKAGEPALVQLCEGLAKINDALTKLVAIAETQKRDAAEARAFADANGLQSTARELGRVPLMAAAVYAIADVPPPPRDPATGHYILSAAWLKQFVGEGAERSRAQAIQKLLNGGTTLIVENVSDVQVAREMLAGRDPNRAAPKPVAPAVHQDAAGWFGFRGNQSNVAPLPDSNVGAG
jgi:hypothetical protein